VRMATPIAAVRHANTLMRPAIAFEDPSVPIGTRGTVNVASKGASAARQNRGF
jgi:hypothetical protein